MSQPLFPVDETTLVFAFRYALGRRSTAPSHVIAQLERHWNSLNDWTQEQICREIKREIELSYHITSNEDPRDYEVWQPVLLWPRKTSVINS